jgi:hypothetical protein
MNVRFMGFFVSDCAFFNSNFQAMEEKIRFRRKFSGLSGRATASMCQKLINAEFRAP